MADARHTSQLVGPTRWEVEEALGKRNIHQDRSAYSDTRMLKSTFGAGSSAYIGRVKPAAIGLFGL